MSCRKALPLLVACTPRKCRWFFFLLHCCFSCRFSPVVLAPATRLFLVDLTIKQPNFARTIKTSTTIKKWRNKYLANYNWSVYNKLILMIFSPYQYSMDFIGAQDVVEQLGGVQHFELWEHTLGGDTYTLTHKKKGTTLIKYEEKAVKTNKNNKNKKFNHIKPKQSKKNEPFFSFQTSQQFVLPFSSSSFSSFFLPILFSLIQFYLKIIIPF